MEKNTVGLTQGLNSTTSTTEEKFLVDLDSRIITVPEALEFIGVEGDNNSEKVYFEVSRYYDHDDTNNGDLSIKKVRIEYVNGAGLYGYYDVPESDIEINDENIIIGWLISEEVTMKAGTISFVLTFTTDEISGNVYRLSTQPCCVKIYKRFCDEINTPASAGTWNELKSDVDSLRSLIEFHREQEVLDHAEKSIKSEHIDDNAVDSNAIADGAIISSKIKKYAVTTEQLGLFAVESKNLADGSVTREKLASDILGVFQGIFKGSVSDLSSLQSTDNGLYIYIPINIEDVHYGWLIYWNGTNAEYLMDYVNIFNSDLEELKRTYASTEKAGLIKLDPNGMSLLSVNPNTGICRVNCSDSYGTRSVNGNVSIAKATNSDIDNRIQGYKPIVPANLEYAFKSMMKSGVAIQDADIRSWNDIRDLKRGFYASGITYNYTLPFEPYGLFIKSYDSLGDAKICIFISGNNLTSGKFLLLDPSHETYTDISEIPDKSITSEKLDRAYLTTQGDGKLADESTECEGYVNVYHILSMSDKGEERESVTYQFYRGRSKKVGEDRKYNWSKPLFEDSVLESQNLGEQIISDINIVDNTITANKIADGAITSSKIGSNITMKNLSGAYYGIVADSEEFDFGIDCKVDNCVITVYGMDVEYDKWYRTDLTNIPESCRVYTTEDNMIDSLYIFPYGSDFSSVENAVGYDYQLVTNNGSPAFLFEDKIIYYCFDSATKTLRVIDTSSLEINNFADITYGVQDSVKAMFYSGVVKVGVSAAGEYIYRLYVNEKIVANSNNNSSYNLKGFEQFNKFTKYSVIESNFNLYHFEEDSTNEICIPVNFDVNSSSVILKGIYTDVSTGDSYMVTPETGETWYLRGTLTFIGY